VGVVNSHHLGVTLNSRVFRGTGSVALAQWWTNSMFFNGAPLKMVVYSPAISFHQIAILWVVLQEHCKLWLQEFPMPSRLFMVGVCIHKVMGGSGGVYSWGNGGCGCHYWTLSANTCCWQPHVLDLSTDLSPPYVCFGTFYVVIKDFARSRAVDSRKNLCSSLPWAMLKWLGFNFRNDLYWSRSLHSCSSHPSKITFPDLKLFTHYKLMQ